MKKNNPSTEHVDLPATLLDEFYTNAVKHGLEEADRGEFPTEEQVERVFRKWTKLESVLLISTLAGVWGV